VAQCYGDRHPWSKNDDLVCAAAQDHLNGETTYPGEPLKHLFNYDFVVRDELGDEKKKKLVLFWDEFEKAYPCVSGSFLRRIPCRPSGPRYALGPTTRT